MRFALAWVNMRRSILVISLGNERNHLGKEQDSKKNDKIQLFLFFIRVFENSSPSLTRKSPSPSLCFTFIFLSLSLKLCLSLSQLSVCLHFHSFSSPLSSKFVLLLRYFLCYLLYFVADGWCLLFVNGWMSWLFKFQTAI